MNDDRILVNGEILASGAIAGRIERPWLYAAVCDGVGGMAQGYKAAEQTLQVMKILDADGMRRGDIRQAAEQANLTVRKTQIATNQKNGMRATLAGLYLSGDASYVVNAGDSRVYRCREGKLTRLSRDHSVVQNLLDTGEITEQEAWHHPQRNVITKCIGDDERVNARIIELTGDVAENDRYLLCSDGVTDVLADEVIEHCMSLADNPEKTCRELLDLSLGAGSTDNISVCIIWNT